MTTDSDEAKGEQKFYYQSNSKQWISIVIEHSFYTWLDKEPFVIDLISGKGLNSDCKVGDIGWLIVHREKLFSIPQDENAQ